jgi:uncharacterized RDD family membrane protein YckC
VGIVVIASKLKSVDHDVAILTPEKALLTYSVAGLGSRIMAHVVDLMVLFAVLYGISMLVTIFGLLFDEGLIIAGMAVTSAALPFLYFILLEAFWNGQTIGKKAMGIRARMIDGTPITPGAAVGRNLLRPADLLPGTYFVGLLAIFTTPRSQRIGDLVAGTIVCHERRPIANFVPAPHIVGLHPLEEHVGELRGMTQEEYYALRRLCDRFPELSTNVQRKLMREVWEPVAAKCSVPELPNVHPIYLAEAVVMKYGRAHGLL